MNYSPNTTNTSYSLKTANSGYSTAQTIAKDSTLTWRILSINGDGSIDLISTVPTSGTVTFSGATGYNNGVYLMNDICEKLYSHGEIKARSINLEDIEEQMTDAGKTARDSYISTKINSLVAGTYRIQSVDKTNKTVTYTTEKSYYPNLYAEEIGAGINTTTVKKYGLTSSNIESLSTTTPAYKQATSGLTVTLTYYNGAFTSLCNAQAASVLTSSNVFWVASRFVSCVPEYAGFGLRYAVSGPYGRVVFGSGTGTYDDAYSLRPVVSLASNIKVTPCTGTNSATNMHKITY